MTTQNLNSLLSKFNTFVVRCLDSIMLLVSISEIASLYLASVAAQAGLSLPWSQISKTGFLVTWRNYNMMSTIIVIIIIVTNNINKSKHYN